MSLSSDRPSFDASAADSSVTPNGAVPSPVVCFDEGGKIDDRPTGVDCPNCQSELVIGEVRACQFAGCPSCGGMLFKQDVFGMLIQHLRAEKSGLSFMPKPINFDDLKVRRLCSSCQTVMETHAYAGPGNAVIDTCFPCRLIFLDQGELTKLAETPGKR